MRIEELKKLHTPAEVAEMMKSVCRVYRKVPGKMDVFHRPVFERVGQFEVDYELMNARYDDIDTKADAENSAFRFELQFQISEDWYSGDVHTLYSNDVHAFDWGKVANDG